jgi:hypothetical protein
MLYYCIALLYFLCVLRSVIFCVLLCCVLLCCAVLCCAMLCGRKTSILNDEVLVSLWLRHGDSFLLQLLSNSLPSEFCFSSLITVRTKFTVCTVYCAALFCIVLCCNWCGWLKYCDSRCTGLTEDSTIQGVNASPSLS